MSEIERSCENSLDYIVCYAYNTLLETGACDNWRLDFSEYQEFIENSNKEKKS